MNTYEIIKKKRDGKALTKEEMNFLINGYTKHNIKDYQLAAFLMAVYYRGMSFDETTNLTIAMMDSGKVFDLSAIPGIKVDKHSTGGVGDKVSLILAPLVACYGVVVPMVSGRGLGHTGGTLDKLESIPGFRTNLTYQEFVTNLKSIGLAMMGQTEELAPADRKIYALRDVTATVDSIPLIAASIMSKKLAEGIDGLVLDVKTGSGAFMPKLSLAKKLAKIMIELGKRMNKKVTAFITDMSQPLGRTVGNALEVIEAIEALKGKGEKDLMEVVLTLGEAMLLMGKKANTKNKARKLLQQSIDQRNALEKFRQLVRLQGGDERVIDDYSLLATAKYQIGVKSSKAGYVAKIDTQKIGMLAVELGAGRKKLEDRIDPAAGFIVNKKIGDLVRVGDILALVLANDIDLARDIALKFSGCYSFQKNRVFKPKLITSHFKP
ncbi:MAG: thymidine phosphorylase [candidate division WOR-3 bacterium]|nr:thymidine phosphorylase [candidate division WOR-3 bacterium]